MEIDSKIWLLINEGNEVAYEKMYFHYYKQFYVYGQKITSDITLVEDSIQEVMIYIWQEREKLSAIKNPPAYFFTFFRNRLVSHLRGKKLGTENEIDQMTSEYSPEQALIDKELSSREDKQLKRAFKELTPRQSEALFLRFYQEMSYEDIAEVMNITIKSAYKLMARSLEELKNNYVPLLAGLVTFLIGFS